MEVDPHLITHLNLISSVIINDGGQKRFLVCLLKNNKKRNASEITEVNLCSCPRHLLMEQLALSISFLFFLNQKF